MTGNEYAERANITNDGGSLFRLNYRMWDNGGKVNVAELLHACLGMAGEAGEVSDLVKKWIFHNKDTDMTHLKKELGDICWYIALACHACGFELDDVLQTNIDKLAARYPEGHFSETRANNRKKGDI